MKPIIHPTLFTQYNAAQWLQTMPVWTRPQYLFELPNNKAKILTSKNHLSILGFGDNSLLLVRYTNNKWHFYPKPFLLASNILMPEPLFLKLDKNNVVPLSEPYNPYFKTHNNKKLKKQIDQIVKNDIATLEKDILDNKPFIDPRYHKNQTQGQFPYAGPFPPFLNNDSNHQKLEMFLNALTIIISDFCQIGYITIQRFSLPTSLKINHKQAKIIVMTKKIERMTKIENWLLKTLPKLSFLDENQLYDSQNRRLIHFEPKSYTFSHHQMMEAKAYMYHQNISVDSLINSVSK